MQSNTLSSAGCSACACGEPGACEQLSYPNFMLPGALILGLLLLIFIVLSRKKIIRIRLTMLVVAWILAVLAFAALVFINIETVGSLTRKAEKECLASGNLACEY